MGALKNLWNSERGMVAVVLIIACTVLLFTGRITVEQWTSYTTWIFGVYAAAKTVTGTAEIFKKNPSPPTTAPGDILGALLSSLAKAPPLPFPTPPAPGPSADVTVNVAPPPKEPS